MPNPVPRNLLVLVADEHRRDALGCMGHPWVQTPHLDALAARGTLFSNAYSPSPICVPARAALATGDHIHRSGHWDSAAPYRGEPRSWMHELRDRGLHVTSIGKLHFVGQGADHGFSEELLPMHVHEGRGWTAALLRKNPPPYTATQDLAAEVGAGDSSYTHYDREICECAVAWLQQPARQHTPWAAFVSFVSPHYPLRAPQEWFARYRSKPLDTPISSPPPTHPELQRLGEFYDYQRHFDPTRAHEARAAYYGLCSFMDHGVGQVLEALRASGQEGETLVIYLSDHGEMLGDHGFWTKQLMYEGSVAVPLIMAGPGAPPGHRVSTPVSLLDVAATARAQVGIHHPTLPGVPLTRLAQEPAQPERTVFSEYHDGGSSTATFMVRWDDWKYIHYVGERPQLFHLRQDPEECHDRAIHPDPEAQQALAEGERRLRAICDPEQVNADCFADQAQRIAALGGEAACRQGTFGHTPTPITPD